MERKLKKMPYAQAHIETCENGDIKLWSYYTNVLTITADGWLNVYGLYSQTTRKHISAFMWEYNTSFQTKLDYQLAKYCYENEIRINLNTGEVMPMYNGKESDL